MKRANQRKNIDELLELASKCETPVIRNTRSKGRYSFNIEIKIKAYKMNTSQNPSMSRIGRVQPNASVQINKSNVTLWKNPNYSSVNNVKTNQSLPTIKPKRPPTEESKQVEGEFIENLKKQIYLMKMKQK